MIDIEGYGNWKKLDREGPYSIFTGIRLGDKRGVRCKALLNNSLNPENLEIMQNEFNHLKGDCTPGVFRLLDFLNQEKLAALIFQDPGYERIYDVLKNSKFDLKSFLQSAVRITEIVCELHHTELIHNNINSKSVFVSIRENKAALCDFELAVRLTNPAGAGRILPNRGGPAYMCPESRKNNQYIREPRSDLYALGVTFYEMLSGSSLIRDPARDIVEFRAHQPLPMPELDQPGFPPALMEIIRKLTGELDGRYKKAVGLYEDLKSCQSQLEVFKTIEYFKPGKLDY